MDSFKEGFEKGKRDRETFEQGCLNEINGKQEENDKLQVSIQKAIVEAEKMLDDMPEYEEGIESSIAVEGRIAELRGKLEALKRGIEAGTLNPNGDPSQEYDEYIKELEKQTKENAGKGFKDSLRVPKNLNPFPSSNTTGMLTGQETEPDRGESLYTGRG